MMFHVPGSSCLGVHYYLVNSVTVLRLAVAIQAAVQGFCFLVRGTASGTTFVTTLTSVLCRARMGVQCVDDLLRERVPAG